MHLHREPQEQHTEVLGESITKVGVINPVTVRRYPLLGNYYGVMSGWRRVQAAMKNGDLEIECKVMRNCSNELAKEIALRANIDCWLSKDEEEQSILDLFKFHTEKERELRGQQPDGVGTRGPGRPTNRDIAAIRKTAADSKRSERTVKRVLDRAETATPETMHTGAITKADTDELTNPAGDASAKNDVAQEVAALVRAIKPVSKKHLDPLLERTAGAGPEVLAEIEASDIEHLIAFKTSVDMLLHRIGRDEEHAKAA